MQFSRSMGFEPKPVCGSNPRKEKGGKMRESLCGGALALVSLSLVGLLLAGPARAQTAVAAGKLVVDAPTLTAIGVEWKIAGDDNRNAAVGDGYWQKRATGPRKGPPALRIPPPRVNKPPAPLPPGDPLPPHPHRQP